MKTPRPAHSLILGLTFCLWAASVQAQVITGVVRADSTQGIAAAEVVISQDDLVQKVVTDAKGRFKASVNPGWFEIDATALGFGKVHSDRIAIQPSQRVVVEVFLTPNPLALAPVVVKARMPIMIGRDGFAYRKERGRKTGFGQFVDADDIARHHDIDISDVLRRLPFVYSPYRSYLSRGPITISGQSYNSPRGGCSYGYRVIVDGSLSLLGLEELDGLMSVQDIMGMEVYRRATEVPGQFGGGLDGCGAIVIWTKH